MPYKDKERALEYKREWNKKNRHRLKICDAKYYQKNKAAILERQRTYKKENYEKIRAQKRVYYKIHTEEQKNRSKKRREQMKSEGRCCDCGCPYLQDGYVVCTNCSARIRKRDLKLDRRKSWNY
jgi:hypothetical protein